MSYSTPVLSGSIPNPVTQPLAGVLDWTESVSGAYIPAPSLLCHFDTAFVDNSLYANPLTAVNGAASAIDSSVKEFGTGSASIPGLGTSSYYATVAPGGPLDITSGDFTVECWIYFKTGSSGASPPLFCMFAPSSDTTVVRGQLYIGSTELFSDVQVALSTGSIDMQLPTATVPIVGDTWYHVALVRQGNNFDCFLNGNPSATGVQSSALNLATIGTINVMGSSGPIPTTNNNYEVWWDEYRLLKGYAAYTPGTPFTPPSAPFSPNAGGGGIPATGYDIYRNGVPLVQVGQVLTYTDTVPSAGTYAYNVAAWDGAADESPLSNEVDLTYTTNFVLGIPNCIFDEAIYGGYFGGQLNLVEFTYMPGRTPFEEGATNLIINRYKQEPTDSRQRGVDFTQFVVPGELLQTVAVTGISAQGVPQANTSPLVTPLVIANVIIDPVTQLKFGYTVSGGQNVIEYTVQFTTTTNIQTETLEEIFSINIMIEDSFP